MSQQINLFNPEFLKKNKYFSTTTILQSLGLIVLGAALFYGYGAYQVNRLSSLSEETAKLYAAEQLKFSSFSNSFSPEKNNQVLRDQLAQLEAEELSQKEIIDTLQGGAIGNTGGYSEYMRAFARQVVSGLWLSGFDIEGDGAQMSLNGGVTNPQLVPSYIQRFRLAGRISDMIDWMVTS